MSNSTPSAGATRRPVQTSRLAPVPDSASGDALARTLAGEYLTGQQQERAEAARLARPSRPWRRIVSIAAIVACAAVWLVPALGTRPVPEVSERRADAEARLNVYLAVQRVRDFQTRRGRLPATLAESGVTDVRLTYRRTGDNEFIIGLSEAGMRWELPSTAADSAYFRDALSRLTN
jgi:hypothetical protein